MILFITLESSQKAGILEIDGGDVVLYITGNINLGNSCEIVVKDKSSLTIYLDGDIVSGNGSSIGTQHPTKDAMTIQLYGTGEGEQNFDIKAKNNWTGVIYAPNANIDLYAKGDAYGAIIANNFEFKSGGNLYYDEALRTVSVEDEGVRLQGEPHSVPGSVDPRLRAHRDARCRSATRRHRE